MNYIKETEQILEEEILSLGLRDIGWQSVMHSLHLQSIPLPIFTMHRYNHRYQCQLRLPYYGKKAWLNLYFRKVGVVKVPSNWLAMKQQCWSVFYTIQYLRCSRKTLKILISNSYGLEENLS